MDKYLKNLLELGRHYYIGASAGSILVGPDIALSGWDPEWDTNDVGIMDTTALNLVPFVVSPHYTQKDRSVLESHKTDYPVIPITDHQAIYWQDGSWQLVGDGEFIHLNNHG
jgi:peptidase E